MIKGMFKLILEYIKFHLKSVILYISFIIIFSVVFYLDNLPLSPIIYAVLLCAFIGIIFVIIDYFLFMKKHLQLQKLENSIILSIEELPSPRNIIQKDYTRLIEILYNDKITRSSSYDSEKRDMIDYFTLWAHQIKTPIAAMRLIMQMDSDSDNTELEAELFKIEQYVEMVLSYLRLDSDTTDFVFKTYDLEEIIRQAVRKYAKLFIRKKINLEVSNVNISVLTDEKWLLFVIEQILSNSLKYTRAGKISIYAEQNQGLVIEDTGIGIAPEDLPRVFEKGFTGYNGRTDKKSTGIGLYLSHRILSKLGHSIEIESKVNVGTKIKISMDCINFMKE